MPKWRIRVVVPDGSDGHRALADSLANFGANEMRTVLDGADGAELTGDVVVETHDESALGDLLRALHEISPQVFISRIPAEPFSDRPAKPIRVRRLRRALGVAS